MPSYLIEFRFSGNMKSVIRDLTKTVSKNGPGKFW